MSTIFAIILTFMSRINFMVSCVQCEIKLLTSGGIFVLSIHIDHVTFPSEVNELGVYSWELLLQPFSISYTYWKVERCNEYFLKSR